MLYVEGMEGLGKVASGHADKGLYQTSWVGSL